MEISIAEKLRPFSHEPGTSCLIPGTTLVMRVYPSCIQVFDLENSPPKLVWETFLDVIGPVRDFTVQQDLEKMRVLVWGASSKWFFPTYGSGSWIQNDS